MDKGKQREATRERVKRYRDKQKGVTGGGVTEEGVTTFFKDGIEYIPASYVYGMRGKKYKNLPERPRYLTLSDGQVLDRANQPEPIHLIEINRLNDAYFGYIPSRRLITG